ncbi:MAG: trypsin-like peptidase domain-containing protein [Nitrospirae bacterium]|nr:trypsin-like peptidase domain-containing protein [Nitrospirota bacterium]
MDVKPGNAQHMGTRKDQQDSVGFSDLSDAAFVRHGGVMAVLADGMGGMEMGRQTSQAALQGMLKRYMSKRPNEDIIDVLYKSLEYANGCAASISGGTNAGTTMAACVVHNSCLYWICAGDSRIYLIRNGTLTQINTDHSYENELMRRFASGELTKEEIYNDPERFTLTSYLGLAELKATDRNVRPYPLTDGDSILLCSDGLYNSLTPAGIMESMAQDPQASAEALVQKAVSGNRTNQDNTSVAILSCQAAPKGKTSFLSKLYNKITFLIITALILTGTIALAENLPIKRMKDSTVRIIDFYNGKIVATGSGFVIGGGYYVVTNWHVVECIKDGCVPSVAVGFEDIREARIVHRSEVKDIAILKVESKLNKPSVELVLSNNVDDAQTVYAIGFPAAADMSRDNLLEPKTTKGIISAKVTSRDGVKMYQTDTPINSGNSGGPLYNENGHVIGINTLVSARKGVQGIGWAVQIDELIPELRAAGIVYSEGNPTANQPQHTQTPRPDHAPTPVPTPAITPQLSESPVPSESPRTPAAASPSNLIYYAAAAAIMVIAIVTALLIIFLNMNKRKSPPHPVNKTPNYGMPPPQAVAPKTDRPFLAGVTGEFASNKIPLQSEPVAIGRDPHKANLVFTKSSNTISGRHCVTGYERTSKSFYIEDCGSRNGTFMGSGERLIANKKYYVKPGTHFYLSDKANMFELIIEK